LLSKPHSGTSIFGWAIVRYVPTPQIKFAESLTPNIVDAENVQEGSWIFSRGMKRESVKFMEGKRNISRHYSH